MDTKRSGPAGRQALLVAVLFARSFGFLASTAPGGEEQRPSLERRVLAALNGAVDALAANMDAVYLDAALGLRVADDRLRKLVDQASEKGGTTSGTTVRLNVTIDDIRTVQHKTSALADIATVRVLGQQEASVSKTLARGLLSKGLWKNPPISYDAFRARIPDDEPELAAPYVIEEVSDGCLQQLFASHKCSQLNDSCWVAMTGGRQRGYALTHQVIFLTVGIWLNCAAKLNALAMEHGQPPADRNLASKCARVAHDALLIVDENFPLSLRDLFMEQVAVCGFMNLPLFKDPSAIEDVLSWQRDDGCYVIENQPAAISLPLRVRRDERKGKNQCSLHMTSIAAGALATYLQILYEKSLANETTWM